MQILASERNRREEERRGSRRREGGEREEGGRKDEMITSTDPNKRVLGSP